MSASGFPFPRTPWTLIRQAYETGAHHQRALLGDILAFYWKPLYAYYRAKGCTQADSEDLVQGLLVRLTTAEEPLPDLATTRRFRDWLLACAKNYSIDMARRERAHKRRPEQGFVSIQKLREDHGDAFEPASSTSPDQAFHATWRRSLLTRSLEVTQAKCEQLGRGNDFAIFLAYYATSGEQPTWREIAAQHRLADWKIATRKADWVKTQLAAAIREQIRPYVDHDEEIDQEIRDLLQ